MSSKDKKRKQADPGEQGGTAVAEGFGATSAPESVINGTEDHGRERKNVEDLMVGHESMNWANKEYAPLMEEHGISAREVYDGLKKVIDGKYDGKNIATDADLQGVLDALVDKKAEDDKLRERQPDTDAPRGVCEWPGHRGKNAEFAPMKEKVLRMEDGKLVVATYPADGNTIWKGDHLTHPVTGERIRVCAKCQPFAFSQITAELQRAHLEANSRTAEEIDRLLQFRTKTELKRVLESTYFDFKRARKTTTFRAYADAKRISDAIKGITEQSERTRGYVSSFRGPARVTRGKPGRGAHSL